MTRTHEAAQADTSYHYSDNDLILLRNALLRSSGLELLPDDRVVVIDSEEDQKDEDRSKEHHRDSFGYANHILSAVTANYTGSGQDNTVNELPNHVSKILRSGLEGLDRRQILVPIRRGENHWNLGQILFDGVERSITISCHDPYGRGILESEIGNVLEEGLKEFTDDGYVLEIKNSEIEAIQTTIRRDGVYCGGYISHLMSSLILDSNHQRKNVWGIDRSIENSQQRTRDIELVSTQLGAVNFARLVSTTQDMRAGLTLAQKTANTLKEAKINRIGDIISSITGEVRRKTIEEEKSGFISELRGSGDDGRLLNELIRRYYQDEFISAEFKSILKEISNGKEGEDMGISTDINHEDLIPILTGEVEKVASVTMEDDAPRDEEEQYSQLAIALNNIYSLGKSRDMLDLIGEIPEDLGIKNDINLDIGQENSNLTKFGEAFEIVTDESDECKKSLWKKAITIMSSFNSGNTEEDNNNVIANMLLDMMHYKELFINEDEEAQKSFYLLANTVFSKLCKNTAEVVKGGAIESLQDELREWSYRIEHIVDEILKKDSKIRNSVEEFMGDMLYNEMYNYAPQEWSQYGQGQIENLQQIIEQYKSDPELSEDEKILIDLLQSFKSIMERVAESLKAESLKEEWYVRLYENLKSFKELKNQNSITALNEAFENIPKDLDLSSYDAKQLQLLFQLSEETKSLARTDALMAKIVQQQDEPLSKFKAKFRERCLELSKQDTRYNFYYIKLMEGDEVEIPSEIVDNIPKEICRLYDFCKVRDSSDVMSMVTKDIIKFYKILLDNDKVDPVHSDVKVSKDVISCVILSLERLDREDEFSSQCLEVVQDILGKINYLLKLEPHSLEDVGHYMYLRNLVAYRTIVEKWGDKISQEKLAQIQLDDGFIDDKIAEIFQSYKERLGQITGTVDDEEVQKYVLDVSSSLNNLTKVYEYSDENVKLASDISEKLGKIFQEYEKNRIQSYKENLGNAVDTLRNFQESGADVTCIEIIDAQSIDCREICYDLENILGRGGNVVRENCDTIREVIDYLGVLEVEGLERLRVLMPEMPKMPDDIERASSTPELEVEGQKVGESVARNLQEAWDYIGQNRLLDKVKAIVEICEAGVDDATKLSVVEQVTIMDGIMEGALSEQLERLSKIDKQVKRPVDDDSKSEPEAKKVKCEKVEPESSSQEPGSSPNKRPKTTKEGHFQLAPASKELTQ